MHFVKNFIKQKLQGAPKLVGEGHTLIGEIFDQYGQCYQTLLNQHEISQSLFTSSNPLCI